MSLIIWFCKLVINCRHAVVQGAFTARMVAEAKLHHFLVHMVSRLPTHLLLLLVSCMST